MQTQTYYMKSNRFVQHFGSMVLLVGVYLPLHNTWLWIRLGIWLLFGYVNNSLVIDCLSFLRHLRISSKNYVKFF